MTVVHKSTGWIKKIIAHVACAMKKGKPPKNDIMCPSNFEGEEPHLNLLKQNHFFFGSSSTIVIHITYYDKVANCLKFVALPKWSRKILEFSLAAPNEGRVQMST